MFDFSPERSAGEEDAIGESSEEEEFESIFSVPRSDQLFRDVAHCRTIQPGDVAIDDDESVDDFEVGSHNESESDS